MNGPRFFLLLLAGLMVNGQDPRWENNFDLPLHFTCPIRQSISRVISQHDDHYEDRMWDFECKHTFDSDPDCFWSGYTNDFDQEFSFECPKNYVLTGMSSFHDDHHEDRRWSFNCCRVDNMCNGDCQWSPYVNYFDEAMSWQVPSQNYMVGAGSVHSNKHEDRRWKYQYCVRKQHC